MSLLPRVSYPGKQAWIGVLISGVWFLFLAMLLGLLAIPGMVIVLLVIHHHGGARISAFRRWLIEIPHEVWTTAAMCGVTFLAAFFAAHSRWIYRPALAAPVAYASAMAVWTGYGLWTIPVHNWVGMVQSLSGEDFLLLFAFAYTPAASAALGGRFGARRFGVE